MRVYSVDFCSSKGAVGSGKPTFGRALTSKENQDNYKLMSDARKALGSKDTYMIAFDTCFPSTKGKNTGVGTSFSQAGRNFVGFMKKMTGISFVQYGPCGKVSKANVCPFSGSVFAMGDHLIDLEQLTGNKYGKILSTKTFNSISKENDLSTVKFDKVLGPNGKQNIALKESFDNFKLLDDSSELKVKYSNFADSADKDWLDRDSLYSALSIKHGNDYWKNWNDDLDRNLFAGKYPKNKVEERKADIREEYSDEIEFNKFVQFIAADQQNDTRNYLKDVLGVKSSGDCLIGFSPRENWAYQSAFKKDAYIGCKDGNEIRDWGLPSIDYEKVGDVNNLGESGKLLKHKFDLFFERYDGARIDAAWQLVAPFVYEQKEGEPLRQKEVPKMGDKVFKILEKSANEHDANPKNITYEMLGGPVDFKDNILKGKTQIEHSIYQNPGWGSVKFYKDNGLDDFTFGLGTHDDKSLIEIADEKQQEQAPVLAKNLKIFNESILKKDKNVFMRAKWAELFTNKNNFFTAFDALGMNVRYNDQKINPDNWTARIPDNYEQIYHKNLIANKGLNTSQALADALEINGKGSKELVFKLRQVASILKEDGVLSEEEANQKYGADYSAIMEDRRLK